MVMTMTTKQYSIHMSVVAGLCLLLGIANLGASNAQGPQCTCPDIPGYLFYPALEHRGDDIRCENVGGVGIAELARRCTASTFCTSFNIFVQDGQTKFCMKYVAAPLYMLEGGSAGSCHGSYMKTIIPQGCPSVSGYTTRVNEDASGGDLVYIPGSVNAIRSACEADCNCKGFNSKGMTKASTSTSSAQGMCFYIRQDTSGCRSPPPPPPPPKSPSPPPPRSPPPPPMQYPALIKSVAIGSYHTCALMYTGKVRCWGQNTYGQLGWPSYTAVGFIVEVDLGGDYIATQISVGNYHTCALLSDGHIKCWGLNLQGQLGHGKSTSLVGARYGDMGNNLPAVDLGSGVRATSVSAGGLHSCATTSDGGVKCWGLNLFGQLGRGDEVTVGLDPNNMGNNMRSVQLGGGEKAVSVALGWFHSCALLASGRIKCWGYGRQGQLGLADPNIGVVGTHPSQMGDSLAAANLAGFATSITSSGHHTCAAVAVAAAGPPAIKCWGSNRYFELGQGDQIPYGLQLNSMGTALRPINLGNGLFPMQVSAGNSYTCAAMYNGKLKCWGMNGYGALGAGTSAISLGGYNTMGDALPFVDLGSDAWVTQVAAGFGYTSCAVLNGGTRLKCWGRNSNRQLGIDGGSRGMTPWDMGNSLPDVDLGNYREGATAPNRIGAGEQGPSPGDLPGANCETCVTLQTTSRSGTTFNEAACNNLQAFLEADSCGTAPATGLSLSCELVDSLTMKVCGAGALDATDAWMQGIDATCAGTLMNMMGTCDGGVTTTSNCGSYGREYESNCKK